MCGITGFVSRQPLPAPELEAVGRRMAEAVRHRGPDDSGVWSDPEQGVCLAHRRLSIVDLSPAGHQPMASHDGRFVLAFNGEIYNHADLRSELHSAGAAPAWRGHSDTETLLAGFAHWGIEATLTRCVGMFAFALWDRQLRTLFLARDRFGEKPLYYGWSSGSFLFGSELKSLRAYPEFRNSVCRSALAQYVRFTYVPAPWSIHEGVFKLEPGCILALRGLPPAQAPSEPLRAPAEFGTVSIRRWWSLSDVVNAGIRAQITDEGEAVEMLQDAIARAVKLQSLADVPLGAFLSGGVDSSTIVALMQQQSARPVKTFTVGFEETGFDESIHARAVARHLGTDHSELVVTPSETRSVIPTLPAMYDEPFADSSQIPTHIVCRAARDKVTVALSGDAGDELFGGYTRYFWGPSIWQRVAWLPFPARKALGSGITALAPRTWDAVGAAFNVVQAAHRRIGRVGDKAHKLAVRLRQVRSAEDLYLSLVSEWPDPDALVRGLCGTGTPAKPFSDPPTAVVSESLRMMYWDAVSYLPDDILCKVDRAAMATSLETRVPFLDHRVAELAWRLPLDMKIRGKEGKWALRQVLYRHVPRALIERPKAGFGIPVGEWLRGPLRNWAEALLDENRIRAEGYFDPTPIRERWKEHLSGRFDWTARLWSILMFQAWLEATF